MKIAIPTNNNEIFGHFGKSKEFTIYETEGNVIKNKNILTTEKEGHDEISSFLSNQSVELVICSGIGSCAKEKLSENNIEMIEKIKGNAEEVVIKHINGETLEQSSSGCCGGHSGHSEEHKCGGNCSSKH